jgi:hypothetical protein
MTVNSGATAPEWATPASGGGLTLLSTTTFANTVTNFTVSSISGSYKNLVIVGSGLQTDVASSGPITLQFNGDTGSNYSAWGIRNNGGTIQSDGTTATTSYQTGIVFAQSTDAASRFGNFQMFIYNYASTSLYKAINSQGACGFNAGIYSNTYAGSWQNNTNAITSIKFTNATSANFKAGTIQIYGVS